MKRKVDGYLDQLQEGPILIGMGILAAAAVAIGAIERHKSKKAERILQKHKKEVDKIILSHVNVISQKAMKMGVAINKLIKGKYKALYNEYPNSFKRAVEDLLKKENYPRNIVRALNQRMFYVVRKTNTPQTNVRFFTDSLELLPSQEMYDEHYDNNPALFKKLEVAYKNLQRDLDKADSTIKPMFDKVIKEIVKHLASKLNLSEGVVNEAGFEDKPKGWDKGSIKKYSKTFTSKMKGNVKSKDFFDKCVKKMQGKVDNPEGFCAALKDEGHGSTYWRGKGKSPKEVKKDVAAHKNVSESHVTDDFLQQLYTDNRGQAKEWRGANIPHGDDSNRPNLIRKCMTLESNRMKINCLRKLRDQVAMNPFYQARLDRFVDAVTGIYEPTNQQGTIPGNEFKETEVGEDFK